MQIIISLCTKKNMLYSLQYSLYMISLTILHLCAQISTINRKKNVNEGKIFIPKYFN